MDFPIDHDYHHHSTLSRGCSDPACTPAAIFALARENGYSAICITDQMWDPAVPGVQMPYIGQTPEHVLKARQYADVEGIRCLVGCETEYAGGDRLGIDRENFDLFDFVVIPPNHMHLSGFVRPSGLTGASEMAELFTRRLEELSALDIPMEKVGIAHLTGSVLYGEGTVCEVIRLMDVDRLRPVFETFARRGAGIELNADAFGEYARWPEDTLLLYRLAKEAGCKFYCASDAHRLADFGRVRRVLPQIVEALGLTADDLYVIP